MYGLVALCLVCELPRLRALTSSCLVCSYGKLYLLLVKNNPKGSPGSPAEVSLCLLSKYPPSFPVAMQLLVSPKTPGNPVAHPECRMPPVHRDGTSKQHTLALDQGGRFAVNVVDNLIVVHHQVSKTSALFDIRWNQRPAAPNERIVGRIPTHHPVAVPQSVAPVHRRSQRRHRLPLTGPWPHVL